MLFIETRFIVAVETPKLTVWCDALLSPSPVGVAPARLLQCYTQPLRVSKEVFKALSKSGIPFYAAKGPPVAARMLSSMIPILYICAIYFFVFKKG